MQLPEHAIGRLPPKVVKMPPVNSHVSKNLSDFAAVIPYLSALASINPSISAVVTAPDGEVDPERLHKGRKENFSVSLISRQSDNKDSNRADSRDQLFQLRVAVSSALGLYERGADARFAPVFSPLNSDWREVVARFSRRYGAEWEIAADDLVPYARLTDAFTDHFLIGSAPALTVDQASVVAMFASVRPYLALDFGDRGRLDPREGVSNRLLALAYREAPVVIATSPLAISQLAVLRLDRAIYIPPPIDESLYAPMPEHNRDSARKKFGASRLLTVHLPDHADEAHVNALIEGICQSAQTDSDKPNAVASDNLKPCVTFIGSGPDSLWRDRIVNSPLATQFQIRWVDPLKCELAASVIGAAEFVVDLAPNGADYSPVLLSAAASNVPVAVSANPASIGSPDNKPPVLYVKDPSEWPAILSKQWWNASATSRALQLHDWFQQNRSRGVISQRLEEALSLAEGHEKSKVAVHSGFDSLRQKRQELVYEAASLDDYEAKYHHGVAYQIMDQKLVDIVASALQSVQSTEPSILDLGCGPGSLIAKLRKIPGAQLTGVDLCPDMIRAAKRDYPDIEFRVDDAESLSFADESFDAVLCSGMLHHLPSLSIVMPEILRVLKPGGALIAREPNNDNFSARHPQLAFAHLCLRHYLFHSLGIRPIVEPDAHDYHRDFSFNELVDEMAQYLWVERFHTDLMVTYFYDEIFKHARHRQRLEVLDRTLSNQPGLNVVVVARKGDRTGVASEVRSEVKRMTPIAPVSPKHYQTMVDFAEDVFHRHPANYFRGVVSSPPLSPSSLAPHIFSDRRILIMGNDAEKIRSTHHQLESLVRHCFRNLDHQRHRGAQIVCAKENEIRPEWYRSFDIGILRIGNPVSATRLVQFLDCVHDYGLNVLDLKLNPAITVTSPFERQYFESMTLLGGVSDRRSGRLRACLGRHLYSNQDFYRAVMVALEREIDRVEGNTRGELQSIYDRVMESLHQSADQYSNLQFTAEQRNLYQAFVNSIRQAA